MASPFVRHMRRVASTAVFVVSTIGVVASSGKCDEPPMRLPLVALQYYAAQDDSTRPGLSLADKEELITQINKLEKRVSGSVEPWLAEREVLQNESLYMAAIVTHHQTIHSLNSRSEAIRVEAILRSLPLASDAERVRFAKTFPSIPTERLYEDSVDGLTDDQAWARNVAFTPLLEKFGVFVAKKGLPLLKQGGKRILKESAEDELRERIREKVFGSDVEKLLQRTKAIQDLVEEMHKRGEELPLTDPSAERMAIACEKVEAIDDAVQRLVKLESDSLNDLTARLDEMKADHEAIQKSVEGIADGVTQTRNAVLSQGKILEQNRKTLLANADRLSEIELALLPQMSSRQQLRLVQKGHLGFADDDQRAAEESRLRVHVVADDAQKYLSDASEILTALSALGISDPEVTKICGDAIRIGGAVSESMKSFANGDIIGAIGGLIGGLLGGGPSTEQQILEQLNKVYELQVDTYNQVIETRKDIAKLSDQIRRQHNEILLHFSVVESQLNKVLDVTDGVLRQDLRKVYEAFSTTGSDAKQRPLEFEELLVKVSDNQEFRKSLVTTYFETMASLVGTAEAGGNHHVSLLARTQQRLDPKDDVERFDKVSVVWNAHLQLLEQHELRNLPLQCSRPAFFIADVTREADLTRPRWNTGLFNELLSPTRVTEAAELVLRMAPLYWCIIKNTEGTYAAVDITKLDNTGRPIQDTWASYGSQLHYRAIAMVDLALMQQSVLHGDFILPRLITSAQRDEAKVILEGNPILRDNCALWLLSGNESDNHNAYSHAYGTFREFENVDALKWTFPRLQSVALARVDATTYMDLPVRTELPPVGRFISGELQTSSEFEMLLNVRRRLERAVKEMAALNSLSDDEAGSVKRLVVENAR